MKRHILFALAGILLLALSACGTREPASGTEADEVSYQTISPRGANALLNSGKNITLVDVRRTDEYEGGHIPGAIHIANEDIGDTRPEALSDLDATILVYCRSGRRSREAADKLIQMGYTDVRDLGGITDWPYDTVTGAEPGTWTPDAPAPTGILSNFSSTNLNGNVVDLSVLADYDLTMINVWATYCGPCLREMPELGELAAEYKDKDVQIIGLVTDVLNSDGSLSDSQLKTARDVVSSTKADYLHMVPSQDLFGLLSQITSVPTTFFVDKDGNQVGSVYIGAKSKSDWASIIDETLGEVSK